MHLQFLYNQNDWKRWFYFPFPCIFFSIENIVAPWFTATFVSLLISLLFLYFNQQIKVCVQNNYYRAYVFISWNLKRNGLKWRKQNEIIFDQTKCRTNSFICSFLWLCIIYSVLLVCAVIKCQPSTEYILIYGIDSLNYIIMTKNLI